MQRRENEKELYASSWRGRWGNKVAVIMPRAGHDWSQEGGSITKGVMADGRRERSRHQAEGGEKRS